MSGPPSLGSGPPGIATRVLRIAVPAADREAVVDELAELYRLRAVRTTEKEARRWYRRQVAVFLWLLLKEGRGRQTRDVRTVFQEALRERERAHRGGGGRMMGNLVFELRGAARRLLRAPVFTLVSVLTVGVGIGAFASIYGLADAVLVEEMPYERPDELVWIWRDYYEASFPRGWLAGPDIVAMREQEDVFAGVAALRTEDANLTSGDGASPAQVRTHLVTPGFFDLLGVTVARGRDLLPTDAEPGSANVAILTHDFWRSHFGGDPGVIGSSIEIDGASTEIIGVAPEGFRFVKHSSLGDPLPADLYTPLRHDLAAQSPGAGMYAGLARVRPNVHPDRVTAALDAAAEPASEWLLSVGGSPVRLWSIRLKEDLVAGVRPAIVALTGSAAFLLLILAANLATLLLGRAAARSHDASVRAALGAGRGRLLFGVAGESVILAGAGAVLGLGLASLGTDLLVRLAPSDLPRLGSVAVDGSVALVGLGIAAGMAVAAGVLPGVLVVGTRIGAVMREGGARSGGSRARSRARGALVAVQVALSLMLLVGAGLTAQAFEALLRQDPGFDPTSTLTFSVPLPESQYPESFDQRGFHDALSEELAALPGVAAVGATTALPLTQETNQRGISFPGALGNTGDSNVDSPLVDWFRITPGYVEAAGLRLIAGRAFDGRDADTTVFNIIIDDVLASRFFPEGSALGARATFFADTATVVGVVDHPRLYTVHADDRGQVFVPAQRFPTGTLSYAVRTADGIVPTSLAPSARSVVSAADPALPLAEVRTLEEIVGASLGQQRLSLALILAFAAGSLILAFLGLYGVVTNSVIRRRQEIGVRMALGASSDEVVRMVVGQGLKLTLAGSLLGLVGALALSGTLEAVVVGLEPRSPLVYLVVLSGLVVVAALASWLPARRATDIDPMTALSAD